LTQILFAKTSFLKSGNSEPRTLTLESIHSQSQVRNPKLETINPELLSSRAKALTFNPQPPALNPNHDRPRNQVGDWYRRRVTSLLHRTQFYQICA